ncbi:hypothetical protein [Streptomyces sp. NPDC046805]|uniref:hypothetical protein n=1 Tax=Streptomyces sp. NPDC046805 TaxID=3155134 RepID=UPI0033FDBF55
MTALNDEPEASAAPGVPHMDAGQIKHLEFIQAVITRFGTNSFLIKGWTLTLAAGFLALSANQKSGQVAGAGIVPLIGFWFLDGYFLRQERLFRRLYDAVRRPGSTVEAMSMNVGPYLAETPMRAAVLSQTLIFFYGALGAADLMLLALWL